MANHLIRETSPYLLQHAHNPVDWYPWGDEAFAEARRRDVPVLLSIGYSACHWCHVMEHESFANVDTAALMNDAFVNIKVDREERPDVDETYMAATQAMNNGRGGWPMTVFVTPDKAPFFAGTYFPPEDRYGAPGFGRLLAHIAELWRAQRSMILEQAREMTEAIRPAPNKSANASRLRILQDGTAAVDTAGIDGAALEGHLNRAVDGWEASFDARFGGFTPAPKFPPASALMCLMQLSARLSRPNIESMVRTTLDAMAQGGLFDHIGGGFSRYSTDETWLVPHFEKMLYDNALLAQAYVAGWVTYRDTRYARVARATLDFMVERMQSDEGGFFAAFDADSEGIEGKFYVWTPDQVADAVPDPHLKALACDYYDIRAGGNWEGRSVPNTPRTLAEVAEVAERHGISAQEAQTRLDRARDLLLQARDRRVPPQCDDKIITAWNGMALTAMAQGARCLGDAGWLQAAVRAADFILNTLRRAGDGRLWRTYRAGKQHIHGYLEDYAFLGTGLLDMYEAGGSKRYLTAATALAEHMLADFYDADAAAFFHTSSEHDRLFGRRREAYDGATPSAVATAARLVGRLARHEPDKAHWEVLSRGALVGDARLFEAAPQAFPTALAALDLLAQPRTELAFVVPPGIDSNPWHHFTRLARADLPACTIAHGPEGSHALLQQRPALAGACTLYVCRERTCAPPITSDAEALPG